MLKSISAKLSTILFLSLVFIVCLAGCGETDEPATISVSPDSKLVCLYFDDAYWNQYHVALPILLKHDFKATFGVITGHIGTGHDLWEYMDEHELRVLAESGMEIACHTRTHPYLTDNLTDEQLREEIIDSKKHLEKMGFKVSTFIYPYYVWDDRVVQYVKDAGYTCARAGWSEYAPYNLSAHQPDAEFYYPSWQISGQSMEEYKAIVDRASSYQVVCLVYHFIADEGPEGLTTPVENFREQMAYLKENGFTTALMPELLGK